LDAIHYRGKRTSTLSAFGSSCGKLIKGRAMSTKILVGSSAGIDSLKFECDCRRWLDDYSLIIFKGSQSQILHWPGPIASNTCGNHVTE